MQIFAWTLGLISLLAILTYMRMEKLVYSQTVEGTYLMGQQAERDAACTAQSTLYQVLSSFEYPSPEKKPENEFFQGKNPDIKKKRNVAPLTQDTAQGLDEEHESKSGIYEIGEEAQGDKKQVKKPLYLDLPPHNSKFNIKFLFDKAKPNTEKVKSVNHYQLAARLLRYLYGQQSFFQKVPNAEYAILDTIIDGSTTNNREMSSKVFLSTTADLALIPMNDPDLREIYYRVLKGGNIPQKSINQEGYPSILEFIILEANRKKESINIHHASVEILTALFDDEKAAKEIVKLRTLLHQRGFRINRNGHNVTEVYLQREDVKSILESAGLVFENFVQVIDFLPNKPILKDLASEIFIKGHDEKNQIEIKKKVRINNKES